jgi:lipopolysaccharide/colanic/teichoic acid biosynthesis glycosyltransferase
MSTAAYLTMGHGMLHQGASVPRAGAARQSYRDTARVLDVALATLGVIILAPLLVVLALAIWLQDGGSPIFAHRRLGRHGLPFPCLKFRTMVVDSDVRLRELLANDVEAAREWNRDHKLRNDPRITALGRILRKTSLDELPQLFNVIAGQMNLVGPRPIVAGEVVRYGRYFTNYCQVRPGITGLWQVSGRNDVSYRRRVALDTVYSRKQSFAVDMFILTRTVPAVLSARGSS